MIDTQERNALAAKRSACQENPGWRRVAPYPGYTVAPLLCRYFAGWRLTPYPAYKNWDVPGCRRVAPYPGYTVAPLLCRYFAGWRLTPYPAYKNWDVPG
ncbi:hypothetical protein AB9D95_19980, partial [Klebsiella africana]|uniref:hypothetical protein n=1 Tax=Klebsiella africana TaxID=2489010 RepID=UPI00350EADC3